jgi:chromosome segregation protein
VFLKSLTLKGFKSFADTSTLEFEPGVTVVVGPNGSGKSNIVDAVAWVLGAQGPRTLRSAKMEDVIFAGTTKRSGLGRAEVSLTIDNSAGLLPIDFSEVRVTRTLWRSGESEYSINGAPCRLLDVQELLSDTGVGRQQHTIISQAQLDTILSARAEDRRAVIEEAAGVSKHRRRKEKAERRLEATEGALLRAQDLLKEVRRQLRPLERQADAARRYADVMAELTALRRHLHGRELSVLGARMTTVAGTKVDLGRAEGSALSTLARLDAAVVASEAALDARRQRAEVTDLAELVSSAEGLRARASGLVALLAERARSIERDRAATIDRDVVSSLEAESASLSDQLAQTDRDALGLLPAEAELEAAEEALARETAELEGAFSGQGGPVPVGLDGVACGRPAATPAQRAGEVRAELLALRRETEQTDAEMRRVNARIEALEARRARLADEAGQSDAASRQAEAGCRLLAQALEEADRQLTATEANVVAVEESRRAADAARHRWSARAEALAQALDEARARAGARRLASVEGVLGALVELVDVDEGLEAAFEAAAGEALSAVLMNGEEAARRGLAYLADQKTPGAVIALGVGEQPAGPFTGGPLPEGATWLRTRVRSTRPAVILLLDRLLAPAVAVDGDWSVAVDVSVARPELVVVTRAGDRCSGGIWRTGAHGTGATGAALEEARGAVRDATGVAEQAALLESEAKAALEQARAGAAGARRAVADNAAARRAALEAYRRASSDIAETKAEVDALASQHRELLQRRSRDSARVSELEELLPALESAADEEARLAASERAARHRLAERGAAVATLRRDFEVRATGIEERRGLLSRRLAEVERRLAGNLAEREQAARRRAHLGAMATAVGRLRTFVQARLVDLEVALERLRDLRRAENEALRAAAEGLETLRRERAGVERQVSVTREQVSRAELEEAQLKARLEALTETVRRELDCEPESLGNAECPPLPPGTSASNRARELERELRLMGPVNPLALEEYAALEERHKFLGGQLHDVAAARRELAKVIKAVDGEIITVFKAAFDDVAENFTKLVATLFPGGYGSLSLTDPSNILESGVELEVRPAGKNIKRLSLLSGGERSLVALAFLFAVFRSRPSPFYMMDEVESALDDVNLHRFLDLVNEFRDEAQLLIVSHQKRTMEAADCLYGVSMPPGGSSLVVSERIERGPRPLAAAPSPVASVP